MNSTVIIDSGSGNLISLLNAVNVCGDERAIISSLPSDIENCSHLILPGQGAFKYSMQYLKDKKLTEPIIAAVNKNIPILGICVGFQLFAECGLEHGITNGFGFIPGRIRYFDEARKNNLSLPHMGWNLVKFLKPHPLFVNLKDQEYFYFAHSFILDLNEKSQQQFIYGDCLYGTNIPAIAVSNNLIGVAFHPEKSQQAGLALLKNFLNWQL